MNNLDFNQTGGFPLTTNILNDMQNAYKLFNEFGHLAGNNSIISGCVILGNNIADGVIFINNEILPFKGGLFSNNSTVVLRENIQEKTFEDSSVKPVLFERYATIGTGGTNVLIATLNRNSNLATLTNYVSNLQELTSGLATRLNVIELKSSIIQKGLIVLWNKPANTIPMGWQEAASFKGRMPMGLDSNTLAYDTVGKTGGATNVTLTANNLPSFTYKNDYFEQDSNNWRGGGDSWGGYVGKAKTKNETYISQNRPIDLINPYRIVLFIEYIGE